MTNITIVGAGFGGVRLAKRLENFFYKNSAVQLTLIDRHDYHLFNPNLYEVATADEEATSVAQLKKSITVPLREVFFGKKVKLVRGEVTEVNLNEKYVYVGKAKIAFDYLALAQGSETDYFGIPGAAQFGMPLKSLPDALKIRNAIDFAFQAHRLDMHKKNMRVVIAGGGYTGVEFAAELKGLVDFLAWKNQYPREKVDIFILEAANELIPGLDKRLSRDALSRLKDLGIRVQLSSPIARVDAHFVELLAGEKIEHDVLVWTTGVKAKPAATVPALTLDRKGRVLTTEYLQAGAHHNIFMLGDQACVMNCDRKPSPPTAQCALDQADYLAYAIPEFMKNRLPKPYLGLKHGFIVAVGGKWAALSYGRWYMKGFLPYLMKRYADFEYFCGLVGFWKALRYILFEIRVYGRND